MPLVGFTAGTTIVSDDVDANFALCVLTDTAKTITVTHVYTLTQTFTGGFTSASTGTLTGLTFTLDVKSVTAFATPSALSATQFTAFASTVSGAAIMGFGTTNDVALMNRAGTVCLGVGPNTTVVNIPGSLLVTGATTLSSALTYGGVALSNAVTGTGNMVLSAAPTFTGTITAASIAASTTCYIGDTSNADVTLGLTINQGAADDQILALKSSDVAHGMTDIAEDDTFGYVAKISATAGGATITGFSETTRAIQFSAFGTADNTTKLATADAYLRIDCRIKAAATVGTPGADANLVAIGSGADMRFLFDVEGSAHADVGWVTF